jgi:hypothetical protein
MKNLSVEEDGLRIKLVIEGFVRDVKIKRLAMYSSRT